MSVSHSARQLHFESFQCKMALIISFSVKQSALNICIFRSIMSNCSFHIIRTAIHYLNAHLLFLSPCLALQRFVYSSCIWIEKKLFFIIIINIDYYCYDIIRNLVCKQFFSFLIFLPPPLLFAFGKYFGKLKWGEIILEEKTVCACVCISVLCTSGA